MRSFRPFINPLNKFGVLGSSGRSYVLKLGFEGQ